MPAPELLCLVPVEERPLGPHSRALFAREWAEGCVRVIKSLDFSPGVKEFQAGYTNSGIALVPQPAADKVNHFQFVAGL